MRRYRAVILAGSLLAVGACSVAVTYLPAAFDATIQNYNNTADHL